MHALVIFTLAPILSVKPAVFDLLMALTIPLTANWRRLRHQSEKQFSLYWSPGRQLLQRWSSGAIFPFGPAYDKFALFISINRR